MTGATWGWGRERGTAAQLSWAQGKDPQQLAVLGLHPPIPNPTCSAGEAKAGDAARVSPAAVLGTSPCPHPTGWGGRLRNPGMAPRTCCCIHCLEQVPSCIRLKLTQGFQGKLSVGYCSASVSLFI